MSRRTKRTETGIGGECYESGYLYDEGAVVYRGELCIGTTNEVDGGEIWQRLHLVHLPLVLRRFAAP
jgi:hypothetical protein